MTYSHTVGYGSRALDVLVGSYRAASSMIPSAAPLPVYNLESKVVQVYDTSRAPIAVADSAATSSTVSSSAYKQNPESLSYLMPHKTEYFSPEPFLNPNRPVTQWIGNAIEVQELVEETFENVTGDRFPRDIVISVVPEEELFAAHAALGGMASPGLQGFSLNRHGFAPSAIIVKQNDLDRLLLTIGHEIGHVLSFSLSDKIAEEAKAFAFELAWMEAIVEHNIGNLALSVNLNAALPENNGLHDVAWRWVQRWRKLGMGGKEIFRQLSANKLQPGEQV